MPNAGDAMASAVEKLPTGHATIVIQVFGAKRAIARMLRTFAAELVREGHTVESAAMTGGVRYDVTDSAMANKRLGTILDAG